MPLKPEVRYFAAEGLTVRSTKRTDEITIVGYPVVYDTPYKVRDAIGEFTETMAPGVARDVLAAGCDCRFLFDHSGLPLARTASGTMTLTDTATRLKAEMRLDARQQLSNDLAIAIQRGDVSQMSCGFVVAAGGDKWDADMENRVIYRFAKLLDVSAVTYPASPTTSIQVAERMAAAVPIASRARLRQLYLSLRDGRPVSRAHVDALRPLLDAEDGVTAAAARRTSTTKSSTITTADLRKQVARSQRARRKATAEQLRDRLANAKRTRPSQL